MHESRKAGSKIVRLSGKTVANKHKWCHSPPMVYTSTLDKHTSKLILQWKFHKLPSYSAGTGYLQYSTQKCVTTEPKQALWWE